MELGKDPNDSTYIKRMTDPGLSVRNRMIWADWLIIVFHSMHTQCIQRGGNEAGSV
jgi:hypothetical protein